MASEMYVDTIAASDGTSPASLTKQSAAKAWLLYDQVNNVTDSSFNISSTTDQTTGRFAFSYSNSFSTRHAVSGLNNRMSFYNLDGADAISTTSIEMATSDDSKTDRDRDENTAVSHGDLA